MNKTSKNLKTPFVALTLGFLTYLVVGLALVMTPFAQKTPVEFMDNLLNVTSALTTTGLFAGSMPDLYTGFGQLVLLVLIQIGAIGYMTLTSFILLARGDKLSSNRLQVLSAEFSMPEGFNIKEFIIDIIIYSAIIEFIGAAALFFNFRHLGLDNSAWSAIFHAISAFGTAGISIYADSLTQFKDNTAVLAVISALCYIGAIGFIVPLDVYRRLTGKSKEITFTTKVILVITFLLLFIGTSVYMWLEDVNLLTAFFQTMSASTSAGFNTVDVGLLRAPVLVVLMCIMIIGASPSGTGGGLRTTSLSAIIGVMTSVLRGHPDKITFMGRLIPTNRATTAVASAILYVVIFLAGIFVLSIINGERQFIDICFEAVTALGNTGLHMNADAIAGSSLWNKLTLVIIMFVGRVSPLTFGYAFFYVGKKCAHRECDLAV